MPYRRSVLALGVALLAASPLASQDSHYWSLHYGPVGQLLGGTTVGGVNDLSSTFYNPGALSLIDNPRFLLSFDTFQISSLRVENGAGEGLDLSNTSIRSIPRIIAGELARNDDSPNRFGYSILTRQQADFNFQTSSALIPPGPELEGEATLVRLDQRMVEYWGGGTWSRRINDKLGVGATMYMALRSQRIRSEILTQDVDDFDARAFIFTDDYSYTHFRFLWKLGVAYREGPLELGATITTPGLGLGGWGSSTFNTARVGSVGEPFLSADVQKGLSSSFRSPLSLSGGASYRWPSTAVHVSAEWFDSVEPFGILAPDPAPIAGSDATVPLGLARSALSVVNWGVGVEHTFSNQGFGIYASTFRDASSFDPDALDTIAAWDLNHVRAGFTFGRSEVQWALGLGYARGRRDVPRLTPPDAPGGSTRAKFNRWNIFFAFSFGS